MFHHIGIIEDINIKRYTNIGSPAFVRIFLFTLLTFLFLLSQVHLHPGTLHAAYTGPAPDSLLKLTSGFAVFVDKKQQKIYVFQSTSGGLDKVFEAPCSTGKVAGAKATEGDGKTPNGIFFATRFETMPDATTTYGSMVYYLDYPNLFDKRTGKNGDNIWIHGTNKPLQPNQSNGCVALRNQDIENLSRYIFLGKTPIIIEESIKWTPLKNLQPQAEEFERLAKGWTKAMVDGDWKTYNSLYLQEGQEPPAQRKTLIQKTSQLKVAKWHFDVMPRDLTICRLDNTAVVMFDQIVALKAPDDIHSSYVKLYLEKQANGWLIVDTVKPAPAPGTKKEPVVQVQARQASEPAARADVPVNNEAKRADREIALLVEKWAANWEKGRMDKYGACYAPGFRSQGKDLKAWVAYKHDLSKRYKNIHVRVENLKVSVSGDRGTATFKQYYKASNMKSSGLKRLDLARIGGEWKIVREGISR